MTKRPFGSYVRKKRMSLRSRDPAFSLRQVAERAELEPSFLSKIERDLAPPPSEARIQALAEVLGEDPDLLLSLAGKVSQDVQNVIRKRAPLLSELIREVRYVPDEAVAQMVREARAEYGKRKR